MISARSFFARMNENRNDTAWLTDEQLLKGTEEFFKLNGYLNIEYNKVFNEGRRTFSSPIVASRTERYENEEISVAIENLMRDGLFVLFLNHRFAYALFDKFENMTKPIPVSD